MAGWLARFLPTNWVEVSPETAEAHPFFGLRGRFLVVLLWLFALSCLSFVIELVLYDSSAIYQRVFHNNVFIFSAMLFIVFGIVRRAWWTRYLAYWMFALTLSNLFLYGEIPGQKEGAAASSDFFFWVMLALLLLRDLPLCVYLTVSRRARLTLEHHLFLPEQRQASALS